MVIVSLQVTVGFYPSVDGGASRTETSGLWPAIAASSSTEISSGNPHECGLARRLFPSTREGDDLGPQLVVIDPERRFGRPLVAGTNLETAVVAERFKAGESWSELARDFGLNEASVAEAVRFETELRRAA